MAPTPASPLPTLPIEQQTIKHPPNQLGLGDPELLRPRLQRPLVLVAYVQLLSDHLYIIYITRCYQSALGIGARRWPAALGGAGIYYARVGKEVLWENDEVVPEPGRRRDEEALEATGVGLCPEGLCSLVVSIVHEVSRTQAERLLVAAIR